MKCLISIGAINFLFSWTYIKIYLFNFKTKNVDNKIFFDPRISINPNIPITMPSLDGCFNETTEYFVFESTNEEDMQHFKYIPIQDNIHRYVIWGTEVMTPMRKIAKELPDIIYNGLNDNKEAVDKIFIEIDHSNAQNL